MQTQIPKLFMLRLVSHRSRAASLCLLAGMAATATLAGQDSSTLKSTSLQSAKAAVLNGAREKVLWQRTMSALTVPSKGCHKATYPAIQWVTVPCINGIQKLRTSPRPRQQLSAGGDSQDFAATRPAGSSSTITQAQGSFDSVITTGETNRSAGPNPVDTRRSEFELQLNTNTFNTPMCGAVKGCVGWEQFLLENDPGSPPTMLQIQSWLLGFASPGNPCPTGWATSGSDCAFTTPAVSVNTQNIASLVPLVMTAKAELNGTDTVSISGTGEDVIYAFNADSLLNLAPNWTTAEFNVFGDQSRHIAVFDPGSTLVVRVTTTIADGSTPVPILVGLTGESNNLNLVKPACSIASPFFAVTFKETNLAGSSYPCPANPPVQNLCADATEEVAYDQKALANAEQARTSQRCLGPASFNCEQAVKSLQQKLVHDEATKAKACK